jgi:hypothetical protein
MKVATYHARCKECRKDFPYPWLGDFSYGPFLFAGEKGGVFGYVNALNHPVWDFLESILIKHGSGKQADSDHADRLQAAFVHFADRIKGQELCIHDVCPVCRSSQVDLWPTENIGTIEVDEITYMEFLSFPESVRRQKVLDFNNAE